MALKTAPAKYREKTAITEFLGNPLIAALPDGISQTEMLRKLMKMPPFSADDRRAERSTRLDLLSRISTIHIPYAQDLFISRSLSRCISWGYVSRNPMPFDVTSGVMEANHIAVTPDLGNYLQETVFPVHGFSVLGISGVGKTCSVLNALSFYPQVIKHTEYNGVPFHCSQLVWLRVDCPGDGSPKGLCIAILRQLDAVLGTNYGSEVTDRIGKDALTSRVSQCLCSHHLGVLVIDDIQNLTAVKEDTTSVMLSFLIYLMETLAIPVVMVGTPKVLSLFQQEFQLAKRATGDGTVRMNLLPENSKEWNRFIKGIWRYQFLSAEVALTPEMNTAFYRESVGNPFLCALLYKLVQDDAITSGDETFTVDDVRKVAGEKLCITTRMRTNMLSGNDEELRSYELMWQAPQIPPEIDDSILTADVPKYNEAANEADELASLIGSELIKRFNVNIAMAARITKEAIIAKGCQNQAETLGYAVTLCQIVISGSQSEEPQSAENPVKTEEKTEQKNSQTTGEPQL